MDNTRLKIDEEYYVEPTGKFAHYEPGRIRIIGIDEEAEIVKAKKISGLSNYEGENIEFSIGSLFDMWCSLITDEAIDYTMSFETMFQEG